MTSPGVRTSSCFHCRMYSEICFCASMPALDLGTRVVIFMQQREFRLVTNTGILARRVLKNSRLVFRGAKDRTVVKRSDFLPDPDPARTFILFPSKDAVELDTRFLEKNPGPLNLICPDGHWGHAKKIVRHEPSLAGLPCVRLPVGGEPSRYGLRRNPVAGNVCTFEAIARALGILEGAAVQREMETVFNKMVSRLLWTRGRIPADQVAW